MLASDLNNPAFVGASNPDDGLQVTFFRKPIQNNFKSELEGRQIFEDVDFVRIVMPGDVLNIHETPVRADHKTKFPRHWAHFQNTQGTEALQVGTPLTQWPILSPSQVEMLRAQKFTTVEQVANAGDLQLQSIGMAGGCAPTALRDKAIRFLTVAKDASIVDHATQELGTLKAEQAEKDRLHAEQLANMQAQIAALSDLMKQQLKPKTKAKTEEPAES